MSTERKYICLTMIAFVIAVAAIIWGGRLLLAGFEKMSDHTLLVLIALFTFLGLFRK